MNINPEKLKGLRNRVRCANLLGKKKVIVDGDLVLDNGTMKRGNGKQVKILFTVAIPIDKDTTYLVLIDEAQETAEEVVVLRQQLLEVVDAAVA